MESCQTSEVQRCIQIGLLCVQEDPTDRPTMSTVVALLGSESMELSPPRQPALSVGNVVPSGLSSTTPSVNELTVSIISPRWRLTKILLANVACSNTGEKSVQKFL